MTIATFIRENTDDGRNIARVLIDVMEGRLDGARISHRLAAARLLTVYGHDDAPDFIADNTPDPTVTESGEKIWLTIDPGLRTLIKARTDDGRVICMFLIDVMEGRIEGIHIGHRVSAARELLNRAFGKSLSRDLPKPPGLKTPKRSTSGTRRKVASTPEAVAFEARVAERVAASNAAQSGPTHQTQPDAYDVGPVYRDPDYDPLYIDEKRLQFSEEELVTCLRKHDSSYSNFRYFQLDHQARLTNDWEISQRDGQILHCLALALIHLNMDAMGALGIGALFSMSPVPESEMTEDLKALKGRLMSNSSA